MLKYSRTVSRVLSVEENVLKQPFPYEILCNKIDASFVTNIFLFIETSLLQITLIRYRNNPIIFI